MSINRLRISPTPSNTPSNTPSITPSSTECPKVITYGSYTSNGCGSFPLTAYTSSILHNSVNYPLTNVSTGFGDIQLGSCLNVLYPYVGYTYRFDFVIDPSLVLCNSSGYVYDRMDYEVISYDGTGSGFPEYTVNEYYYLGGVLVNTIPNLPIFVLSQTVETCVVGISNLLPQFRVALPTPSPTPTNTATPTNTPTNTPTQTPNPLCPQQLTLSGSSIRPNQIIDDGTYLRITSSGSTSFLGGYLIASTDGSSSTNAIVAGTAPDGNTYAFFLQYPPSPLDLNYNLIARSFNSVGTDRGWAVFECFNNPFTGGSITSCGNVRGAFGFITDGSVRFPPTGTQTFNNGGASATGTTYISYSVLCPTPSPTATPTNTPTQTQTPGLSPSSTPTNTPSPTPSPSNTNTPTPSPSNTNTPTPTATPTETPCINCYEYFFTASTSGLLSWLDCDGIMTDTFVNEGETYTIGCSPNGARQGSVSGTGTIVQGDLCSSTCITPTPTRTSTQTPSVSPTNTSTPSITETNTPTPSITPTQTNSPTITPSITSSPTETPSGQLFIYGRYIGSTQEVGYTINSGTYIGIGDPTSSCDYLTTISGLQINDVIDFMTIGTCAIGGDTTTCPSGTSGCNYQHTFNGTTYIYLTIDASNCC